MYSGEILNVHFRHKMWNLTFYGDKSHLTEKEFKITLVEAITDIKWLLPLHINLFIPYFYQFSVFFCVFRVIRCFFRLFDRYSMFWNVYLGANNFPYVCLSFLEFMRYKLYYNKHLCHQNSNNLFYNYYIQSKSDFNLEIWSFRSLLRSNVDPMWDMNQYEWQYWYLTLFQISYMIQIHPLFN